MIAWLLGGQPGSVGTLTWTAPDWVPLVAGVVALVALGASLRGERSLMARLAELALWALALAGLVVALARPVWVEEEGRTEPGRVAVLVDASASMAVREDGAPRSASVAAMVERYAAEGAEILHFGEQLASGAPAAFDLPGTDLETAMRQLNDRFAGEKLASVILLTDGLDRGPLRRTWLKGGEPTPPALPGPLTVHAVGELAAVKDLSVRFVDAGGYAYIHTPFRIRAELVGVGFEGRTIQADLLKNGGVVNSQRVALDAEGKGEVVFEVTPDRAGRFSFVVQVPDYEEDAVLANNVMPVVVRVVRDRIRVLQVAGAPSWDVKFLRRFLKGDPSVDLVSFFILRTKQDLRRPKEWRDEELSLIQFPYTQLFTDDLDSFDLVVFQDFDYEPYFGAQSRKLLENLRGFVQDRGKAIVMVGGDRSFSLGRYGATPLGDILPVAISPAKVPPNTEPFRPVPTEAGARHPITRLVSDLEENELWWSRLHMLDGTNVGFSARPDASVLLTHPTQTDPSGAPLPVLSVREVGNGRTMALSVDTSWRWSLSEAAEGRGNQAYLRFWKGAIRWLIQDSTTARVTVETPRENYAVGDEVRIVVRARDADFAPLANGPVHVEVVQGARSWTFDGETGEEGDVIVPYTAERRGAHAVEVTVGTRADEQTSATVFAVTSRDPELDEVAPDPGFLVWLAERMDGRFIPAGEEGEALVDTEAGRTAYDRRELAVWRSPLMALWVAGFAGLAWLVRRRAGLR